MSIRFVTGKRPGRGTGFDINYADILQMEECRGIVVISAIFGNNFSYSCFLYFFFLFMYFLLFVPIGLAHFVSISPANFDVLHQPRNISEISKKNVCFYMFLDEETEFVIKKAGRIHRKAKMIGLWRLVVVKNLPYEDARRTGKVHTFFSRIVFRLLFGGNILLQTFQ